MRLLLRRRPPPIPVFVPDVDPADAKAERLLLKHCTPEQVRTWKRSSYICVQGSAGGRFCLHDLYAFCRVFEHDERGMHTDMFCSYLAENDDGLYEVVLPIGDQILAHKLAIETSETRFRVTAPRTSLAGTGALYHPHHGDA